MQYQFVSFNAQRMLGLVWLCFNGTIHVFGTKNFDFDKQYCVQKCNLIIVLEKFYSVIKHFALLKCSITNLKIVHKNRGFWKLFIKRDISKYWVYGEKPYSSEQYTSAYTWFKFTQFKISKILINIQKCKQRGLIRTYSLHFKNKIKSKMTGHRWPIQSDTMALNALVIYMAAGLQSLIRSAWRHDPLLLLIWNHGQM